MKLIDADELLKTLYKMKEQYEKDGAYYVHSIHTATDTDFGRTPDMRDVMDDTVCYYQNQAFEFVVDDIIFSIEHMQAKKVDDDSTKD